MRVSTLPGQPSSLHCHLRIVKQHPILCCNFETEWNVKCDSKKYFIEVYAKTEGRTNSENKYDFPPPIDNALFFGS